MTASRATELQRQLVSGSGSVVASAVAMPPGQSISPDVAASLKLAAAGLSFRPDTFKQLDDTTAEITATGNGRPWKVYLVWVSGTWRISLTSQDTP